MFQLGVADENLASKLKRLPNLASLDLSGNRIGDDGARVIASSLRSLTSLNFSDSKIGEMGSWAIATLLPNLTSLDLSSNNIGDSVAKAVTSLSKLTSINLSNNNIGDEGANAVSSLKELISLDLSFNRIGPEGARQIALRGQFTFLNLRANRIGDRGAQAIAATLKRLTSLDLARNDIGLVGARAIAASLVRLTSLYLDHNEIRNDGARAIAASLTGLTSLSLNSSNIGVEGIRAIARSLRNLTSLDLAGNRIGDAGVIAIAQTLKDLIALNLADNRVGDEGARAIAISLERLTSLDLKRNNFGAHGAATLLRAWLAQERAGRLERIDLSGNRDFGEMLPKEVLETTDAQAVLAAFRRFTIAQQKGNAKPLNEVKLLVVGNEAVGKTSVLRYMISNLPRDPSQTKTPGVVQHEKIDVRGWSPQTSPVQINVWDFGGQEMLRGTHRFFLTERSLYLLILEDRRQDDRSIYDWLKTIRNHGADSPIIVVINKSDHGKQDLRLDETGLQMSYPNIVAFLRTSCDPSDWARNSIQKLREAIVDTITSDVRLKHVRDPIPTPWLYIKSRIGELAEQHSVLPYADFISLCANPRTDIEPVTDGSEQRALLRLLHDLGTIVAHGLERDARAAQREINLLDPNWLTFAIYKIIDKASSIEQDGEFCRGDIIDWLDPVSYPPEWHEFILLMMQHDEIGLCFRLPTPGEERYLLPEALPANRRFYGNWPEDSLRFRYIYNYLPPGLIPRFIVQSHQHLTQERARWRTGVVLSVRKCEALIIADVDQKRVEIMVTGPSALRRGALNAVLNDLDVVHELNPEAGPVGWVPLPDRPDAHIGYEYNYLLKLEQRRGRGFAIPSPVGADRDYQVSELLDGIRRDFSSPKLHVVVLVHGIRTQALWQNELLKTLEGADFIVQPTNYGYFDIGRFLFPWQIFAGPTVRNITMQVRHTLAMYRNADCSIIAHSFGTLIVARMLRDNTDLEFNKIIFCGSVVPQSFRFEDYRKRFDSPLLNEVGTHDFWPVLANVATFGYGSAGTFGFRRPGVRDRWHNGKAHSDFLTPEFCRKYWIPYLSGERIADNDAIVEAPPWWLWLVSTVQIKYVFLIVTAVSITFLSHPIQHVRSWLSW